MTTTTTLPVTRLPADVSRYVSFSGGFADGRRLGNQLFCFAAVVYVAELTGREPAIEKFRYVIQLDEVFDLNVERFDSLCPCHSINEGRHLAFDEATDAQALSSREAVNKSILVGGFRQSWRYTMAIERRLRRHLTFKEEIRNFSERFLRSHIPPGWNRAGFVRVAIHVRRGDILSKRLSDYGYTFPNMSYFSSAMAHFTGRYKRVQFLTFSDDVEWTKKSIKEDLVTPTNSSVNVTHVSGHSGGQDMAIMSMCDHVIMTTGTYGWWAAWLAKGITVYYGNWPRNGSGLEKQFKRDDFFPPYWIPMTD